MPTFDIKEITEMKLVNMDTGEEISNFMPVVNIESLTDEYTSNEFEAKPTTWNQDLTWEFECPQTDYYKIRNALIGRGKKKYRYKQIHNVFKRWGNSDDC